MRLQEIEARTDKANVTQDNKRRRLARLSEIALVTEKSALEKLNKVDVIDQACIRGLKNMQKLTKGEIVALCLANPSWPR